MPGLHARFFYSHLSTIDCNNDYYAVSLGGRLSMNGRITQWTAAVVVMISAAAGCARMPYTTKTVHEDFRVAVDVQHETTPARYSHPVQLTAEQIAAILRNFSLREEQRLPLRWFAEEAAPKPIFREEELVWVSP